MGSGDITQTGPREAVIRGVADALGPAHEKMANAILHLAESHETQRHMDASARDTNHQLWTEVRDDLRIMQGELRTGFDRIVKAVENLPQSSSAPTAAPPSDPNAFSIPKSWLPFILIAIFGGDAAPALIARFYAPQSPPPVQTVYVTPTGEVIGNSPIQPGAPISPGPSVPLGPGGTP